MRNWTRRDLLKSGVAASAAAGQNGAPARQAAPTPDIPNPSDAPSGITRERLLLDFGWRFHLGHAWDAARDFEFGGNAQAAQTFAKAGEFLPVCGPRFDDGAWQAIDLPHDWAVALPFVNAAPLVAHGCKPLGRAYPETSIGWYRRVFDLPASDAGRRLSLEFDGVFRNALVVFNGHYMGEHGSGYVPFRHDITDYANCGGRNVLVVRVDATLNEGWFYEGAGIYRHAWLTKTSPLHVAHQGTFVRSRLRGGGATLLVTTEIDNDGADDAACELLSQILDGAGKLVAHHRAMVGTVPAGTRRAVEQRIALPHAEPWSVDTPHLYRLQSVVARNGRDVDHHDTPFGIRDIRFDASRGFFLNGQPLKIKGTCNHQDHGGVGTALPDRLQVYRLERLREMGSNAVRASHNPPTPELLDACDRMGMLVVNETRMMASTPEGLEQLEALIRRDRNHPSVILWCLGNEELEQTTERGTRIVNSMRRLAHRLDPTRPVTVAQNREFGKGVSLAVDVQGCNYREEQIDGFHQKFPRQPMIGTETGSIVSTRGAYRTDAERGYVGAFDSTIYRWPGAAQDWWKIYAARDFLSGAFAWTGFDYRGEPTPYTWPCISSHFGLLDTCGFPKDNFYYHQAWWSGKPVLYLLPHWNWPGKEGEEMEIWAHCNLERVELLLNGQSLGSQPVVANERLVWRVKYAPGTLEARAFRDGKQALVFRRETTGAPARLVLKPDRARLRADGEDVAMVAVEVQDAQGRVVPVAHDVVTFRIAGAGTLLGVCNGDPSSHEADQATSRAAFQGLCMAIVQTSRQAGEIRVEASAPGLESAAVVMVSEAARPRPAV